MALSVAPMALEQLASWLVASGEYATVPEAMAAFNIVITDGVGATGTAIAVSGGAAPAVIGTAGQTALEVAAQAELAATGTNVTTAGIGLLQGETTTTAAALLGMDMGIVAAAAAPVLGVSLGVNLYESNPELWTKISQKLLPFCYPGTTKIPTWAEIAETAWTTSVAKKVIDALKELFEEEGVPTSETEPEGYTSDLTTYWNQPIVTGGTVTFPSVTLDISSKAAVSVSNNKIYIVVVGDYLNEEVFWSGNNSTTANETYTYQGKTVYHGAATYSYFQSATSGSPNNPSNSLPGSLERGKIAWTIKYGTPSGLDYPEGTARWDGNIPAEIPQTKPAVVGYDAPSGAVTTQPMVPISPPIIIITEPAPEVEPEPETIPFPWPKPATVPETTPWPETMPWPLPEEQPEWWPVEIPYPYSYPEPVPSPDPEAQPDPEKVTDPEKQVEPYILPLPLPYELPVPEPYPQPDPDLDPTKPRPPTQVTTDDLPPIGLGPDPIGISPWPSLPDTPLAFSQGGGLVTVYHPTPTELYSFEQWLWVTYADATIDKIFNNPFDGVITLFELYCTPTDVGSQTIKSGFLDSGINSAVISRYTEIDCGTLGIPEYYGNYLDYSPYSKAHVYLPFIGVVELNVDDIVGHAVNITYRIDEYNGSCIAMITVAKVTEVNGEQVEYSNTMYQFSGNCAVELPLAGGSQAAIKAGMMQANAYQNAANISAGASLVGGIGSLLMGSIGGTISGIGSAASNYAYGQANALSNMLSGKSTVQKSGTFGSSHGAMGIKVPFITVTRPKQIQVPNYNDLYGYPAHKMVYVGECTGFIRCREVNVISATANDEEKTLIEQLLKTGVYVTDE